MCEDDLNVEGDISEHRRIVSALPFLILAAVFFGDGSSHSSSTRRLANHTGPCGARAPRSENVHLIALSDLAELRDF